MPAESYFSYYSNNKQIQIKLNQLECIILFIPFISHYFLKFAGLNLNLFLFTYFLIYLAFYHNNNLCCNVHAKTVACNGKYFSTH